MGKIAGYVETYSALLNGIAEEADAIAIRYFRTAGLHVERKSDGTAVTPADRAVEEMARDKVAKSRLALDVLGEEMGGANQGRPGPVCSSRSEEHTSELQSRFDLVCRLLLEKKKKKKNQISETKTKRT